MPDIRRGRHTGRWTIVAVAVVAVACGGGTAWALTGSSGPAYRTATVTRANVTQTLLSTGTIEPVSQASVSFPVSGQVSSVGVGLGSHVSAGQTLARLTTTALAAQVSAAQSAVATATVRLAADEASETTTTALITSDPGSGGTTSGATGSGGKSSTSSELAEITRDQAALRAAQQRLDAQLTAAKSLLAAETSLCATTPAPTSSPTGPTSPAPTPTYSTTHSAPAPTPTTPTPTTPTPTYSTTWSSTPPTPTYPATQSSPPSTQTSSATATTDATVTALSGRPGGAPASPPTPTTCQAAITDVMTEQQGIATAEQSLATSESDLTKLLTEVASAAGKSAGSGSTGSGGGTGAAGSGSHSGGIGGATSGPATAAQLAADQASLDSANAQLSLARQNMAAATLVAPIAGTVALVNVTPGQQVTGSQGSGSTADFVIEGAGGEEATTTVSVSDVGEIRVGQPASITLDGSATSLSGQVVAVGMLSATSSSGTTSDPVTIGLAAGAPTLFAGSDAQVAITLAQVSDAVTVPTSAIEGTGAATFVTVLQAGKPARVRVVTGAAGPVVTQVTSGLTVGEQVILADMSTPLPTNTNPFAARGLTGGGGGGFVGGGGRTGTGTTGGRTTAG